MSEEFMALQESCIVEVVYATEGALKLRYGDQTIRMEQGDLCVLPTGVTGGTSAVSESSSPSSMIRRKHHSRALGMAAPIVPMRWRVLPRHVEEFEQLLGSLSGEEREAFEPLTDSLFAGWERFMDWMLHNTSKAVLQPFEWDESPIRQALYIMGYRFMMPLTVTEISKHVAMSTRHFQRMFKMATGKSFVKLLQEIRIRHSCGLLQFSRLSVQAVAETVGISDMYSFYRLFRSHCGMTPAAFRLREQV